jgi:hypothetical protein
MASITSVSIYFFLHFLDLNFPVHHKNVIEKTIMIKFKMVTKPKWSPENLKLTQKLWTDLNTWPLFRNAKEWRSTIFLLPVRNRRHFILLKNTRSTLGHTVWQPFGILENTTSIKCCKFYFKMTLKKIIKIRLNLYLIWIFLWKNRVFTILNILKLEAPLDSLVGILKIIVRF